MKSLKEFKPLIKLIKEDRIKLIIASVIIFISGLSQTLVGYLIGESVEAISKLNLKDALFYLVIYLLLSIIIFSLLEQIANAIFNKSESKITQKLGEKVYVKALNLPAAAYEKKSSGEIINIITTDTNSLSNTFETLISLVSSLVASIIVLIYIFYNSWIIGLEIIFFVLILYLVIKKYNPILKDIIKKRKQEQDKYASLVNESIRGIREIKTLGIKKNLINEIKEIVETIFNITNKEIDLQKKFNIYTNIIRVLLEVGSFITCAILVYTKDVSLAFFVAMTYYIYRFTWLIERINVLTQTYQRVTVSLERVNKIIENREFQDEMFGNETVKNSKGVLMFKNVTFGYPGEESTLNNFNLTVKPNKKVAIVGASGQGKSTLFNLITRIFDPNEGEILLDGVDIKTLTEEDLRKNISIIRQEPFIFNRTIKENFELINKNISLEEIRYYCKMAYLDDYIMSLPNKYDTMLGEGGVNLSGGQKQRLSIARTLSRKSKVILFDEATSALDNSSQEFIKKAIDKLVENHTVIIVAHRLSTIIDADVIHVVSKGKIVDSGTHEQLLKTSNIYKTLYNSEL